MNILVCLPDPNDQHPSKCVNDQGCGFTPCVCNPSRHFFQWRAGTNACRLCGAPESQHDDTELRALIAEHEEPPKAAPAQEPVTGPGRPAWEAERARALREGPFFW